MGVLNLQDAHQQLSIAVQPGKPQLWQWLSVYLDRRAARLSSEELLYGASPFSEWARTVR